MNVYQEMARAMEIFASYPVNRGGNVSAAHDEIWAGPDPTVVSAEHLAELEQLGWRASESHETFHKFV